MRKLIIAALLAAMAGAASAQDYNSAPNYGVVRLSPGFRPDPHMVSLRAGGSIDARTRFSDCRGFITQAPDIRLFWDGNGSLPLRLSVTSNADTTLVVNGPGGEWYCDDDSGGGTNPAVALNPTAGRYEIWVGTYSAGTSQPAYLAISELTNY